MNENNTTFFLVAYYCYISISSSLIYSPNGEGRDNSKNLAVNKEEKFAKRNEDCFFNNFNKNGNFILSKTLLSKRKDIRDKNKLLLQ